MMFLIGLLIGLLIGATIMLVLILVDAYRSDRFPPSDER